MHSLTIAAAALDAATRGRPVIDELIVGSIIVFILNFLLINYLFKRKRNILKHVAVVLISALAFLINVFLKGSSLKMPLTLVHTIIFIASYYFILWKSNDKKGFKHFIPSFFMSVFYILCIMAAEGTYRAIVHIGDITALLNDASGTMQKYLVMMPIAAVLVVVAFFIDKAIHKKTQNN